MTEQVGNNPEIKSANHTQRLMGVMLEFGRLANTMQAARASNSPKNSDIGSRSDIAAANNQHVEGHGTLAWVLNDATSVRWVRATLERDTGQPGPEATGPEVLAYLLKDSEGNLSLDSTCPVTLAEPSRSDWTGSMYYLRGGDSPAADMVTDTSPAVSISPANLGEYVDKLHALLQAAQQQSGPPSSS
jgi:hypothetical protein